MFLKLTERTVCKPLILAENDFYRSLHIAGPDLLPFTPKYLGSLTLTGDKSVVTGKDVVSVMIPGKEELGRMFGDIAIVPADPEELPDAQEGNSLGKNSPRLNFASFSPSSSVRSIPGAGAGAWVAERESGRKGCDDDDLQPLIYDSELLDLVEEEDDEDELADSLDQRRSRASSRSSRKSLRFEEQDMEGTNGAEDLLSRSFEDHVFPFYDQDDDDDDDATSEDSEADLGSESSREAEISLHPPVFGHTRKRSAGTDPERRK